MFHCLTTRMGFPRILWSNTTTWWRRVILGSPLGDVKGRGFLLGIPRWRYHSGMWTNHIFVGLIQPVLLLVLNPTVANSGMEASLVRGWNDFLGSKNPFSKKYIIASICSNPNKHTAAWWRHQMEHFRRYWPFVQEIHRSPVYSPQKGQWRGALMFSLICAWINGWVNNRKGGDLRRHRAHYDVIVTK